MVHISTSLAGQIADYSAHDRPGLLAIANATLQANAPTVAIGRSDAEDAITELARLSEDMRPCIALAEALSNEVRR